MLIKFKCIIIATAIACISCSPKDIANTEIPLLIITDFGRDVDDAQAFAYLAKTINSYKNANKTNDNKYGKLKIAGVICTGYIPQIRAKSLELFLNLYGIALPIAITEPEKTEQEVANYYALHSLNYKPYELTLLKKLGSYPPNTKLWNTMQGVNYHNKYISPTHLIDSLLNIYPATLRIVLLAQATQLANYIDKKNSLPNFHSLYIQGQCDTLNINSTTRAIKPNFAAYNLREDTIAAKTIFKLQNTVPFIFVSKYAAYPLAFTKEETEIIGKAGYVGDYLKNAACMGLESFLERDSATFYKIFKLSPQIPAHIRNSSPAIDSLNVLNNPYDLLTVIAIDKPRLFAADTVYVGNIPHILIDRNATHTHKQAFWFW
ncbi:MAG: hypothetical protein RSC28_06125 [Bacteroidales bacterium]